MSHVLCGGMTTTSFEITNMAKKKNTMLFKSVDTNNSKVQQTLSNRSRGLCADLCRTLLVLSLCVSLVSSEVVDLCNVDGCVCANNPSRDDLIDVNCQCQSGQVRNTICTFFNKFNVHNLLDHKKYF